MDDYPLYDRDLSWLSFNKRVLMEAAKSEVPLLERLKFVAIYSSNLDEFFRVRVASHRYLARIGKKKIKKGLGFKPKKLVKKILKVVKDDLNEYGVIYRRVLEGLSKEGMIIGPEWKDIPAEAERDLLHFFKTSVMAMLRPRYFDSDAADFLDNQKLYFALKLSDEEGKEISLFLNIPSDRLRRFYHYQHNGKHYYIFLDDILKNYLDLVFPGKEIVECKSVKLNKDADLYIDDEYSGDLVEKIDKQVSKRNLGKPSRFLYDGSISQDFLQEIAFKLQLEEADLVKGGRYHNLNDLMQIKNPDKPELEYEEEVPVLHPAFEGRHSLLNVIEEKDQILHFPYHSYDYALQFFNEAANHPEVTAIDVTFYRMAANSMIAESLITAALNGKKVTVFMEVKARFDERNNLRWARKMNDAGIEIIYSIPGLKVHAKVAQITRKTKGKTIMYGFFGTGNLNENTARTYTDHCLLSTHDEMNRELHSVFKFLHEKKKPGDFNHLIVSQFGALDEFIGLIDREIQNVKDGGEGKIYIKINNLEEKEIIHKLYEAVEAGVDVKLLVRSICCAVPLDERGPVLIRNVDRYLEHSRLYYFYDNGKEHLFAGSSDWMYRNLHNRVEVSFPIYDKDVKDELMQILMLQLKDDHQGVFLNENMENVPRVRKEGTIRSQFEIYRLLKDSNN